MSNEDLFTTEFMYFIDLHIVTDCVKRSSTKVWARSNLNSIYHKKKLQLLQTDASRMLG